MYTIAKIETPVKVDGNPDKRIWQQAESLEINCSPWYKKGDQQATEVKAAYNDTFFYLLFLCEDRHISAAVTRLNGPVSKDSCVEFFASPEPDKRPHYFNLEFNCCGCLLAGYGPDRYERARITPELAKPIEIYHSIPGPTKADSPEDDGWLIEAAIPFRVLSELCGTRVPAAGTTWKANFYRCGGMTDLQFAAWAPINTARPDFHRPEFFKEMVFQ